MPKNDDDDYTLIVANKKFEVHVLDPKKDRRDNVRVTLYSDWNEVNLKTWLAPQRAAPRIYRRLVYAAHDGLAASGHGGDQMLIGELLPFARHGKTGKEKTRPLPFLRELACVDNHYRPYRG